MFRPVPAIIFVLTLFSIGVQGQASNKLNWTQDALSLADAQSYTYRLYADGSLTGTVVSSVTCNGTTSPYACQIPFPIFSPGNHTIQLTAENITGESAKSTPPFAFVFPVAPKCCTISK